MQRVAYRGVGARTLFLRFMRSYCDRCYRTVPWSVCLSVYHFQLHCSQTAQDVDSISFAYDSLMSLPDRVKIWITSVKLSTLPPLIWPQSDPPPVDFSVGDNWWQIAAEWSEIAQRSQWRAYRKLPLLFRMVPSLTRLTSHSPKMGVPNAPPTSNFATSAATWRIW